MQGLHMLRKFRALQWLFSEMRHPSFFQFKQIAGSICEALDPYVRAPKRAFYDWHPSVSYAMRGATSAWRGSWSSGVHPAVNPLSPRAPVGSRGPVGCLMAGRQGELSLFRMPHVTAPEGASRRPGRWLSRAALTKAEVQEELARRWADAPPFQPSFVCCLGGGQCCAAGELLTRLLLRGTCPRPKRAPRKPWLTTAW